jgi:multidrug efflux pump
LRRAGWFDRLYLAALRPALRHPAKVVVLGIAILAGTAYAYVAHFNAGVEFFPEVEPDRVTLQIHARGNLSIDERDSLVREVEDVVQSLQERNREFASVYTVVKAEVGGRAGGQELPEDVIGLITLEFADWNQRRKADAIIEEMRAGTADIAGIEVEIQKDEGGPQSGKQIHLQLSSPDHAALARAAAIVRAKLDAEPGLLDVEDSRPVPGIEWQMSVDRAEAAKYGIDVTSVGNAVQLVTRGLKFGDFRPDDSDDEIDIVARFPVAVRTSANSTSFACRRRRAPSRFPIS